MLGSNFFAAPRVGACSAAVRACRSDRTAVFFWTNSPFRGGMQGRGWRVHYDRRMHLFALASMLAAPTAAAPEAIAPAEPSANVRLVAPDTGDAPRSTAAAPSAPRAGLNAAIQPFGAKDSWRWQLLGSWIGDFQGASQLEAEWSASWFFMQNVSLDFGLSGDAILQPGLDAGGGGASIMFRWHFLARQAWSVYADLGCGMLFTNEPVPSDGGRVNFTPRAGLGGTIEVSPSVRLMGGARWYHISNANTGESNPGRDSLQVYGGLSFPF